MAIKKKFGKSRSDIILTGLPRSGTSMVCYLLNKVENVVALVEPLEISGWQNKKRTDYLNDIDSFFASARNKILRGKPVKTKLINNKIPSNTIASDFVRGRSLLSSVSRLVSKALFKKTYKSGIANRGEIIIDKPLIEDYSLCIKHPGLFTTLLPDLTKEYKCYAIIRNPLAALASWNSVNIPVSKGHHLIGEKFNEDLKRALMKESDQLTRQLIILSWMFKRYKTCLHKRYIIKYEQIVSSGGTALSVISKNAKNLKEPLENKNINKLYDREFMRYASKVLLKSKGEYWNFYARKEVLALIDRIDN